MYILGIETSCDETGVAVYASDGGLLAQSLASQTALHKDFGGVVPELASRDHVRVLAPMVEAVLADAGIERSALAAVAYTAGPGLIGALMVGGAFAAALAYGLGIPAVAVHHMEGHLLAPMLEDDAPSFPFLALLVSGGHTQLVEARGLGEYRIIGDTLDDAAGEAFDKVARMLDLPYPGGPALAKLALLGRAERFAFPRPLQHRGLDFSFSGLKTAVKIVVERLSAAAADGLDEQTRADIAASFQAAAVDSLVAKVKRALAHTGADKLIVAGGVGANVLLRQSLSKLGRTLGVGVYYPRPDLCTDNGAMIAFAGWCRRFAVIESRPSITARPRWPLEELTPPR